MASMLPLHQNYKAKLKYLDVGGHKKVLRAEN